MAQIENQLENQNGTPSNIASAPSIAVDDAAIMQAVELLKTLQQSGVRIPGVRFVEEKVRPPRLVLETFNLAEDEKVRLKELAARLGSSKSGLIRQAVKLVLKATEEELQEILLL